METSCTLPEMCKNNGQAPKGYRHYKVKFRLDEGYEITLR